MELSKGIDARILLDSVNRAGNRLTTFILKYPRFIHAELLTHRQFSRNSSSSRAIPTKRLLKKIEEDPAMPVHWGKNQRGMQARAALSEDEIEQARQLWLWNRDRALDSARRLNNLGLHKQITNRILEPWMHIVVLVSSTQYANFFHQRAHADAQPEIFELASKMKQLYARSEPQHLAPGEWHLPFVTDELREDYHTTELVKISVGRCARVSYETYDGKTDPDADIKLHDRLYFASPPHASPFEHVAQAWGQNTPFGNFRGFKQYRQHVPNESQPKINDMVPMGTLGWPDDTWKGSPERDPRYYNQV